MRISTQVSLLVAGQLCLVSSTSCVFAAAGEGSIPTVTHRRRLHDTGLQREPVKTNATSKAYKQDQDGKLEESPDFCDGHNVHGSDSTIRSEAEDYLPLLCIVLQSGNESSRTLFLVDGSTTNLLKETSTKSIYVPSSAIRSGCDNVDDESQLHIVRADFSSPPPSSCSYNERDSQKMGDQDDFTGPTSFRYSLEVVPLLFYITAAIVFCQLAQIAFGCAVYGWKCNSAWLDSNRSNDDPSPGRRFRNDESLTSAGSRVILSYTRALYHGQMQVGADSAISKRSNKAEGGIAPILSAQSTESAMPSIKPLDSGEDDGCGENSFDSAEEEGNPFQGGSKTGERTKTSNATFNENATTILKTASLCEGRVRSGRPLDGVDVECERSVVNVDDTKDFEGGAVVGEELTRSKEKKTSTIRNDAEMRETSGRLPATKPLNVVDTRYERHYMSDEQILVAPTESGDENISTYRPLRNVSNKTVAETVNAIEAKKDPDESPGVKFTHGKEWTRKATVLKMAEFRRSAGIRSSPSRGRIHTVKQTNLATERRSKSVYPKVARSPPSNRGRRLPFQKKPIRSGSKTNTRKFRPHKQSVNHSDVTVDVGVVGKTTFESAESFLVERLEEILRSDK